MESMRKRGRDSEREGGREDGKETERGREIILAIQLYCFA